MGEPKLKSCREWEEVFNTLILDADGWRSGTASLYAKSWDERISRGEFVIRSCSSTFRKLATGGVNDKF